MELRIAILLSLLASAGVLARADDGGRPNIILVMADDQGWGDMAYNGHPHLKTPNFDRAAAEGLRFDRFYAAAPVCSPTRASVLTGRTPNRSAVFKWGHPIRPQEVTVAEVLAGAGYRTAHFGKWHLGSVRNGSPANPGANGFQFWSSAPNFYENNPIFSSKGMATRMKGESSMVTVDGALDFVKGALAEKAPFFVVIWFGSPHLPHIALAGDRAPYRHLPERDQNFLGEITGMDRAYGKLRDKLEEWKIRENTILWYCSDNGALPGVGSSGGHRGHKGKVYEGGLLVPSILEWPARLGKPRSTGMRCITSDIYPTLLEIAGARVEQQPLIDGVSLVPLIDGVTESREKAFGFWDYPVGGISTPSAKWMQELLEEQQKGGDLKPHPSSQRAAELPNPKFPLDSFPGHSAWVSGDWKLHRIQGRGEREASWELYDLARDRAEARDLFARQTVVAARLREELEDWLQSVSRSMNGEDY